MYKLLIICCLIPLSVYGQLNYHYESKKDSFEIRFPEKPEVKELKWSGKDQNGDDIIMFARNYKAGELFNNGFAMYDVTYTSKYDGSPINFKSKQIPNAMEGYIKGLMFQLHNSQKIYFTHFMYDNKYHALEYKIKCTALDKPMFKKGFVVLKDGKFINIAIMYNQFNEKIYKVRYEKFTKWFKF